MEHTPNASQASSPNGHTGRKSLLPTLTVMICTVGTDGMERAAKVLLPPERGVDYVVSVQDTEADLAPAMPEALRRPDVTVSGLPGRGLSRNRNHALELARGELLLVADDDERLLPDTLREVRRLMGEHSNVDIALFRFSGPDGAWPKHYPAAPADYAEAERRGYYASSWEMALRRRVKDIGLRFNELFGLGSPALCAGEEAVLLADAMRLGLRIRLFPLKVGTTDLHTTGTRFLQSPQVQRTKGATFQYCYGTARALWLCLREAAHYALRGQASPWPILRHMFSGLSYARNHVGRTPRRPFPTSAHPSAHT